jgi:hypothetical protein
MISTVPAYFGKFSLVWPAIFCSFGNPDIYSKIRNFSLKSSSKETIYLVVRFKMIKFCQILFIFMIKKAIKQIKNFIDKN